ncbi:MAG: hypothetical protein AB202_00840 [Parcubacteria bacterium C7867-007]|nr:MAG: hypothetical protein AB202_00840 [Parcubacteria bacterium C7867-007]
MKGPVTEAGYRRQECRVNTAKTILNRCTDELTGDRCGENSTGEGKAIDRACAGTERDTARARWEAEVRTLNSISIAQEPTANCHVCTGHPVTIKWIDPPAKKKVGETETVILGGFGESWDNVDHDGTVLGPPTRSYNSPFGSALKGAAMGDEPYFMGPGHNGSRPVELCFKVLAIGETRIAELQAAA